MLYLTPNLTKGVIYNIIQSIIKMFFIMRKLSFLFFFVFSPGAMVSGVIGSPEKGKSKVELVSIESSPTNVKELTKSDSLTIAIETLSNWQTASGSYYDPMDSSQTKENCDGVGSFERLIQSGSIALGSSFTKFFIEKKKEIQVFIEVKNLNVVTPFGKGIFRLDDSMGNTFTKNKNFFLDFHEENLSSNLKRQGRFKVKFRIHRIQKIKNLTAGL